MRALAWLTLVMGCDRGGDAPTLSTPSGAAHCQLAAVKAQSVDRWMDCMHPDLRASRPELEKAIARKPDFWKDAAAKMEPLGRVTDAQFTISESRATYRYLEKDALELVKQDGRWYVVDTGY